MRGRDVELARLAERLRTAAVGHGQTAFVEGAAGIGKTRLVAEVAALAEGRGLQIFQGRGEELEITRPFGVLADALGCRRRSPDPARSAIGRLITGDMGGGSDGLLSSDPGLRYRVVEALTELVEDLASAQPVVLILEDLHWADPSTLLAVRALGRRLRYTPVTLVGTFRPTPRRGDLQSLVETLTDDGGLLLRLSPLAEPAVTLLATDVLGAPPGLRLRNQLSRAGGSPLFVLELLNALRDGDAAEGAALPPTLRQTILRRLGIVSDGTVELLRLASILGSTLSLADLATICRRPVVELLPALDEAFQAGLMGEAGDQLAFRHDVVREAVYDDLSNAVRVGLHREAGYALAAKGAPASQVAVHLGIGATPGDIEAVDWLCRAAREVAPRAPGVAADFYGRAAALMPVADPARDGMVAEQIFALLWAGRMGEGQALAGQLLRRCRDSAIEVRLRVALSWALAMQGNLRDAVVVSDASPAASAMSERERLRLRATSALSRATRGDVDSVGMAAAAQAQAEALGDDVAWCAAGSALSLAAMAEGQLADAITGATSVMKRAGGDPLSEMQQMVCCLVLVRCLTLADRLGEAAEILDEGRRISRERGSVWNLPLLHYAAGMKSFLAGDWDDAVTETEAGLAAAAEVGAPLHAVSAHGLLALLAIHCGQPAVTRDHLKSIEDELVRTEPSPGRFWLAWAQGMGHDAAERPGQALDWLERAWTEASAAGTTFFAYPLLGPDLIRLALAAGQVDRARGVTAVVASAAARMDTASADAAALRCQGLTDADPAVLLRAVGCYRRAPRPFERARACEDAALALGRTGGLAEAQALFDEALAIYETLGARQHVVRATQAVRQLGLSRRRRRGRSRPTVGWDALTEQELRVVDLVVTGLTNSQMGTRLCISHHTVATHLAHIFAKLGVASKVELAAQAAGRSSSQ
ncbi:MAG: helix-turn-helix transcriptional regulator [Egibacteraceae bacterium]